MDLHNVVKVRTCQLSLWYVFTSKLQRHWILSVSSIVATKPRKEPLPCYDSQAGIVHPWPVRRESSFLGLRLHPRWPGITYSCPQCSVGHQARPLSHFAGEHLPSIASEYACETSHCRHC